MVANFYDYFKNKDLKNMFKRLCIQNQQRKFNALWQMLDQLTAEQVKVRASGTSTSQAAEARNSIEKPFSHWIRDAPKEKWRVMRQFGQRQEFPVPTALERVSRQDHR